MKNLLSFLSIVLLVTMTFSSNLTAQTYKQRVRSAELLRQVLPPELKITADNVRRATQKDIRATISAAGYAPDYAAALEEMLIPAKVIDWRGLIIEITSDCNERIEATFTTTDGESFIHMIFPPGKKCEKLFLRMVELGLVYPFDEWVPADEYDVCVTKNCITSYTGDCCWNIILGVPKGKECPPPSCQPKSCECKVEIDDDFYVTIYMEE